LDRLAHALEQGPAAHGFGDDQTLDPGPGRRSDRADVAVQHKILTTIWHMLTHDVAYHDLGPGYFDRKPRSLQQ
jgi:hypothetical protein